MAMKQVTAGDIVVLLEKEKERLEEHLRFPGSLEEQSARIGIICINHLLEKINSLAYCPSCDSVQETESRVYTTDGIFPTCLTCGEKIEGE